MGHDINNLFSQHLFYSRPNRAIRLYEALQKIISLQTLPDQVRENLLSKLAIGFGCCWADDQVSVLDKALDLIFDAELFKKLNRDGNLPLPRYGNTFPHFILHVRLH
jgi:hypothetical protein